MKAVDIHMNESYYINYKGIFKVIGKVEKQEGEQQRFICFNEVDGTRIFNARQFMHQILPNGKSTMRL